MSLTGLLPALQPDPAVADLLDAVATRGSRVYGAPAGIRPALVAAVTGAVIAGDAPVGLPAHRPVLLVTASGREAEESSDALRCYLPEHEVAVLPAWETLPHERLSPRADTVARRLAVFRRLAHPSDTDPAAGPIRVLVVPVRALLQPVATGLGDLEPVMLHLGDQADLGDVTQRLLDAAYARVDMVSKRGEFAVRGGILDVFPPTEDHPLRIEFWGDEVTEMRWFSVADQRSLAVAETGLWAPPCRELLLTDAVRARAADLVPRLPAASEMLLKLSEGIAVEGMESLMPALVPHMQPVLDLVPADWLVMVSDPERVRRRAHDLVATTEEFLAAAWSSAATGGETPIDLRAASFVTLEDAREHALARDLGWWELTALGGPAGEEAADGPVPADLPGGIVRIDARDVHTYRGDVAGAVADLRRLTHDGWRLVLITQGAGTARRMVEQLSEADVPARGVETIDVVPEPGIVLVATAPVTRGFVAEGLRLAVFTDRDITGRPGTSTRDMRRIPARRRGAVVDPLALTPGDHVVHEQHGVGRFVELVQRTVGTGKDATTREYMVIEYASSKRGQPGDRLFVPSDSLDQVSKYSGGEAPTLSKMGGADWARTKGRARRAVREIAAELIRLYVARTATQGHAFSSDTPWQRELEDAFAHVETPDQLVTIDEVKADMEKSMPMDRLVSGDVGYGKTEIAVRAAFKAVQDGKQVAILVPTTLLVQQHFDTFSERYAGFPVTVKALSRFQSDTEAREVADGLREGKVDVVIGTHRLLTGDVRFKDLGLVVIDEEQRFGVEHKETLKQLRTNVDVLAMSATPIPRTLEMAVTGIREMSTLATPPEERHPILTYVGAYEEKQVAAAIRRELLRDGQVFYVHNRVSSIGRAASRLAELVPEARIAVAHGQMGEHQLERVIADFWNREYDVLVCTTIVETGLDISNANTLIVERADVFGLSQLHQLRGRVGRGRERGYAYFLYPPEKPLTETAHDRLATIASHTDLGAGIQVAMKDLEIRGAGNLLGGEQSGHIAGVGFDLYVRMVADAVATFRGQKEQEKAEVRIELPVDAHVPHDYIEHERLRLEAYAKIAAVEDAEGISAIREELVDRYGPVPEPVERLFSVAALRTAAREVGLAEITAQGKYVRLTPVELPESGQLRLKRLYPGTVLKPAIRTVLVPAPMTAKLGGKPVKDAALLEWVNTLIDAVLRGSVAASAAVSVPG